MIPNCSSSTCEKCRRTVPSISSGRCFRFLPTLKHHRRDLRTLSRQYLKPTCSTARIAKGKKKSSTRTPLRFPCPISLSVSALLAGGLVSCWCWDWRGCWYAVWCAEERGTRGRVLTWWRWCTDTFVLIFIRRTFSAFHPRRGRVRRFHLANGAQGPQPQKRE
ncbi:hypothetical protein DFH09DRAFT_1138274 [Mycena vulgaris]|nr:hypothetical protein DFH09DRAFT_1138274 [Mycena vulgaris]